MGDIANALSMVNCIPARIKGPDQQAMFEGSPRGIAGTAILEGAIRQVEMFRGLIQQEKAGARLELIGVGGVSTSDDVVRFLAKGALGVQLATAAMLDPEVGIRIRKDLAKVAIFGRASSAGRR